MKPAISNGKCRWRHPKNCRECRANTEFRAASALPNECGDTKGPATGLGDIVEKLAKPIAKALGLGCLDKAGKLKPESGCAKRRDAMNRL